MSLINVLVVDDSVVVRRLVTSALEGESGIRVVGTAPNGKVALQKVEQCAPDVVTLDIEMPEMDGLTTVKHLRRTHPRLPVVMFSTLTERGASATLEALANGANDYVTKPANVGSVAESIASVREQLVPKIRALAGARGGPGAPLAGGPAARPGPSYASSIARPRRTAGPATAGTRPRPGGSAPVEVLAIGCSTGGPEALAQVLAHLPGDLRVPVVVVQHMPPVFTKLFAERLDRSVPLRVVEATGDVELVPGTVHIAPGDSHLEVVAGPGGRPRTRLQQGPPENFCRPAVDVLFRSVAAVYGGGTLAVVLTGMGADGKRGCEPLKAAGAAVLAQDQATSVVWGMPGAVTQAGLADEVLPLQDIARTIRDRVGAPRAAALTAGRR